MPSSKPKKPLFGKFFWLIGPLEDGYELYAYTSEKDALEAVENDYDSGDTLITKVQVHEELNVVTHWRSEVVTRKVFDHKEVVRG